MNKLVKFFTDEDGAKLECHDRVWHLVSSTSDAERALCNGQAFGFGESAVNYETKEKKRGGITCDACLLDLKYYKNIKL